MLEIDAHKRTHGVGGGAAVRHIILSAPVSLHSCCQIAPVWIVPSVIDADPPCAPLGRLVLAASRCFARIASHNITLTNSGEQTRAQRPRQSSAPLSPPPVSKGLSVENRCQNISVKKNLENSVCVCCLADCTDLC